MRENAAQSRGSLANTETARAARKSMRERASGLWAHFKSICTQGNIEQQQEGLARAPERVAEQSVAQNGAQLCLLADGPGGGRQAQVRHRWCGPGPCNPLPLSSRHMPTHSRSLNACRRTLQQGASQHFLSAQPALWQEEELTGQPSGSVGPTDKVFCMVSLPPAAAPALRRRPGAAAPT
jgi:hypothetical protein